MYRSVPDEIVDVKPITLFSFFNHMVFPVMNTGQIIRLIRTADGLAQGALAERLNVSRTYLCQIENGRKQASLSFLKNFSQQFSVPLPLLFFGEQTQVANDEIMAELREIFARVLVSRASQVEGTI
ncbi:MAG: helix-turn-helix transcriptional regulator [Phycisphaerae bacterium]|nr:helix-turn-helix transcriptional regulator [Phycisphaerae bacterium]